MNGRPRPKGLGPPQKCTARTKSTGKQCGQWAIQGGTVCRTHGGMAPQVKAAANRRRAEARARGMLGTLDPKVIEDPFSELQKLAGEMVTLKDRLRDQVENLTQIRYQSGDGEQLRAELAAYGQLLRDCSGTLATLVKLGLDERMVRIREAQAEMIKKALEGALRRAGLEGQPLADARKELARRLRVVA